MSSVTIVANPHAGRGRAGRVARESVELLRMNGVEVDVLMPEGLTAMRDQLAALCTNGPTTLIACGGDGTVHQVLQAVVPSGSRLGIIPAGTGNDIARSLGIPIKNLNLYLKNLGRLITHDTTRRVDVAELMHDGVKHWALGVISAGFDSAVNERADRMNRLSGTTRYIAALLAELIDFRMHDYRLRIDEHEVAGAALLVAVGNGPGYGGGMKICPSADMTDGLLDITWVDKGPRRTVLRVFPRIYSGAHVHHPLVTTYQAREIEIDAPGAVIYADGDRIGHAPIRIAVMPKHVQLLAPTHDTST